MFRKADVVDEMEIGFEDVVGCLIVKHLDEKRYDSLDDDGIGVGGVMHLAFGRKLRVEPNTALATLDEMVGVKDIYETVDDYNSVSCISLRFQEGCFQGQ